MQIMMQDMKLYIMQNFLKSNLCDYNDANILVRGDTTIIGNQITQVAFTNCTPFIKCIPKIYATTIDDAEDLDFNDANVHSNRI